MAMGRPAAQVALYHPTTSMWLGDEDADRSTTKLSKELMEHQIDFDYFDEQSLTSVASIEHGAFKNLSGQEYRALVIPSSVVISRLGLERLRKFAGSGGKVIFAGKTPDAVVDKAFLHPEGAPDLSFATLGTIRQHHTGGPCRTSTTGRPSGKSLHVPINGVNLEPRAWQPYCWDVTGILKPGKNVIQIEVQLAPAPRRIAPVPTTPGVVPPGGGTGNLPTANPPLPQSGILGSIRLVTCK